MSSGRAIADFVKIDAGDVEIYHPHCRTKILITSMVVQHNARKNWVAVEGVCRKCDCYVHLRLFESGLE